MKKNNRIAIAFALTMCIILMSVSTVFASSTTTTEWADPTAHANGDASYSATVLTPYELPGTVNNDASMIIPAGFNGMKQFGGNAIKISGLATSKDTAAITFAFPTYSYGWTGGIYQWVDGKWVAVASTLVNPGDESKIYYVTAPKVGNGIYALLVAYK